jgi:putative transposase
MTQALNPEDYNLPKEVYQLLQERDSDRFAAIITSIVNHAMLMERQQALKAGPYERSEERLGHANGFKDKNYQTGVGKLKLKIPQVRGGLEFYPEAIDKGIRSERALKLAVAEMYVQGVSTRKVAEITEKLCGFQVSSAQVSNLSSSLDDEIEQWRSRALGKIRFLMLDATYLNVRMSGSVVSAAFLVAVGINDKGNREVLGTSVSVNEAEIHWREFLLGLQKRGLHGLELITSDAHAGLKAALKACFSGVPWQRCQFHLQQNAQAFVTKQSMKKEVASDIRAIFNAPNGEEAERYLKKTIEKYTTGMPKLAEWMDGNIRESLTVFILPESLRRKLRTSNMLERQMKEVKRRTNVVMVFPNEKAALRLVSSVFIEIDEGWKSSRAYLKLD